MPDDNNPGKGKRERKKIKFSFRVKKFRFQARNYITYKIKRSFSYSRVAVFIGLVFSLAIGFLHGSIISSRLPPDGANYFITIGAAVIGVLAILFTLNTLLINNSLNKLPSALYQLFVTDLRLDLIFIGIASAAVSLFVMGFSFQAENGTPRYKMYRVALIIMVWVIVLIYLFYKRVQAVLSPNYQLLHFTRSIKKDIDEITYLANKYADISASVQGASKEDKDLIKAGVYRQLAPKVKGIIYNLSQLANLHFRQIENGDKTLAGDYLTAIMASIIGYLNSRKDNSVALPSRMLIVSESDLGKFLEQSVEILEPIWLSYLKNNDLEGIRLFLSMYKGIVATTLKIKPINNPNENPAFDSAYLPLSRFMDKSIAEKNEEAMFQSANTLAQIAADSANENFYISPLQSIFKDLEKLFAAGITNKMFTITSETIEAFQSITLGILKQKQINSTELELAKDEWEKLLNILSAGVGNSTLSDISMRFFADNLLAAGAGNMDESPTLEQLKRFIEVSEFVLELARKTYASNNGKAIVGEVFNRPLEVIAEAIFDFISKGVEPQIRQDLDRILNGIASTLRLMKINPNDDRLLRLNDLIESHTKIGLFACSNQRYDNAALIFNSLMSVADKLLLNPKTVRDATRVAVKGGYIACALRQGAPGIYTQLKEKLHAFEKEYINKVFSDGIKEDVRYSLSPFTIRTAFDSLINDSQYMRSGLPKVFDRSNDILVEMVDIESIEAFRNDVWMPGSHPRDLLDKTPETTNDTELPKESPSPKK